MVNAVQGALRARGIEDEVVAAGQFNPRGHSGGLFLGARLRATTWRGALASRQVLWRGWMLPLLPASCETGCWSV